MTNESEITYQIVYLVVVVVITVLDLLLLLSSTLFVHLEKKEDDMPHYICEFSYYEYKC